MLPALECGMAFHYCNALCAATSGTLCTESESGLSEAVTQVNTWDDHDTFDGWGSYPPKLQRCPLFQVIFQQSQRFYTIFQLATTVELAAADGFFVVPPSKDCLYSAVNFATQLGPSLAVVAPDSRSQRSKTQILSDGTFNWLIIAVRIL